MQIKIMHMQMNKLKQLEEWYDSIQKQKQGLYNSYSMGSTIQIIDFYYKHALADLLQKEYSSSDAKPDLDKIYHLTQLASAMACKNISQELAQKYIHENVEKINEHLTEIKISEDEFTAQTDDYLRAYYDTECLLNNFFHKEQPIETFKGLIKKYKIDMEAGGDDNCMFCFTLKDKGAEKNSVFQCNNLYEFMNDCSPLLVKKVRNELLSNMELCLDTIKAGSREPFDLNKAKEMKDLELYHYLNRFEYICLNFSLADLYILLFYKEIDDFKNQACMQKLKDELMNLSV